MVVLSIAQLVGLLKDKNPVVRQLALENLLPYTQTGNPHVGVWEANNWAGGRILKVLTRDTNVPLWKFVVLTEDAKYVTAGDCRTDKFVVS
jgi:hypothetical protein